MAAGMQPSFHRTLALTLIAAASLALSACATADAQYPSLAKRPAERIVATYDTPAVPVEIVREAPGAQVLGQLGGLVAAARAADRKFRGHEARARSLVGGAGAAKLGSESWGTATIAVSELESDRAQAMLALADLDVLFNDTAVAGLDLGEIGAARDTVTGLIAHHDRVLGELRGRLGS